jgi:hypothetical protein
MFRHKLRALLAMVALMLASVTVAPPSLALGTTRVLKVPVAAVRLAGAGRSASSSAATAKVKGLRYVALGDSVPYGHGLANPGTKPQSGLPADQGPSPLAWPSWVDKWLPGLAPLTLRPTGCALTGPQGQHYDQLAISGAPTEVNKWTGKDTDCYPKIANVPAHKAVVPNEINAADLRADPPALVTIQAGADDIDFPGCLANLLIGGGDRCVTRDAHGYLLTTKAIAEMKSVKAGLEKTIADIHAAAPKARIVLVDYYQLIPSASEPVQGTSLICRDLRLARPGGAWRVHLRDAAEYVQARLNGAIEAAAKSSPNVAVVDIGNLFAGHEMCTPHAWIYDGGINDWRAAHPTEQGQKMIAQAVVNYCVRNHCLGQQTGGGWWAAIKAPLPADAATSPNVQLSSVACQSPSRCVAVGDYVDSSGYTQGVLLTKSGTSWTAAKAPLPGNAATTPSSSLESIACPSASWCVTVGYYTDSAGKDQGLLLTWSGTRWTPAEAPLPPADPGGQPVSGSPVTVACASASMCVAAGTYAEYYANVAATAGSGLLLTWSGTSWTAIKAPVPVGGQTGSAAFPWTGAACSSVSCLVVGSYSDSSLTPQGLLLTRSGTSWTAAEAPVPAGTDLSGGQAGLREAACPGASACTAVGYYQVYSTSAHNYGLIVTGDGSAWKVADAVSDQGFGSVACPSRTSCAIGGTGLLLTGSGTTWRSTAPSSAGGGLLTSVSCPSVSSCAVAAQSPSDSWDGGLVLTRAGSTWTSTLVPLPHGFSGSADLNSISCFSATTCVAIGEGDLSGSFQGVLMSGPS